MCRNSTAQSPHKPEKPADCPLLAHASRRWAKRIQAQHRYFGVMDELFVALDRYAAFESAKRAGNDVATALKNAFNKEDIPDNDDVMRSTGEAD